MRCAFFLVATLALLTWSELRAQPGPAPGQTTPGMRPSGSAGGGPKVCLVEMKATTRVVHGSVCKDYCRSHSCVSDFFRSCFGMKCSDCDCGTVRTYNVLTKKVVPGPDVPVCRVKDLSTLCPDPAATLPQPVRMNP